MKIVKMIVFILFGIGFIVFGLNKFFNFMPVPELTEVQKAMFGHFMGITWLMPLAGIAEVAAGVLVISSRTRALGAIIIFPVMIGIMAHNLISDQSGLAMAAVFFVINLWMIADNWKKYEPMIK